MSAREVASRFAAEIGDGYGFAIVNFANPDMVGHTGVIPGRRRRRSRRSTRCLGEVVEAVDASRRGIAHHS